MDKITINYKIHKDICHCCHQELPEPEAIKDMDFTFSKRNMMDYAPWEDIVEIDEEFDEIVEEFVYDTIRFFAMSSDDKLVVKPTELTKVKKFILKSVS